MAWVVNIIFTTVFAYIGWAIGEPLDMGLAIFLSLIGMIGGWPVSRRFMVWPNA
ncbi:MAG: hypothetical protein ACOY9J_09700 [Pseudomonadota bacterium]